MKLHTSREGKSIRKWTERWKTCQNWKPFCFLSVTPFMFSSFVSHRKLTSTTTILPSHLACASPPPSPPPHPSFLFAVFPPSSATLQPHSSFPSQLSKRVSHLGILTAFSRDQPAPQRDLNRGELCDGFLPENRVTPPLSFPRMLFDGLHLDIFHVCLFVASGRAEDLCGP